jgi:hypothetical protein
MPFGGLLAAGIIGAGGSIIGGLFGANGAKKAAAAQVAQQEKALQFQQQVYNDQKQNQAPFVQAGQYSIGQLMDGIKNGQFGPGSIPDFKAPTAEEARNTPGYQFTADQGSLGIERGAAAAGGAFTGGTLKALAGFNSGLADSTYNDTFNRSLTAYNALLGKQSQEYNQLAGVAQIGQGGIQSINNTGSQVASNVGNIYSNIGNAQSAGIIGSTNAITGGISGAANAAATPFYLNYLKQRNAAVQDTPTSGIVRSQAGYVGGGAG